MFRRGMVKLIQDLNREEVIPRAHAGEVVARREGGRTQGGWLVPNLTCISNLEVLVPQG